VAVGETGSRVEAVESLVVAIGGLGFRSSSAAVEMEGSLVTIALGSRLVL
jgi:hypothetical protein